jgi:hypothetical protein
MLLDAWLKLGIFGPIVLLVLLLCVPLLGFALFRAFSTCRRLLREGAVEQFWLTAGLVALLCVPIAALIVTSFVDTREERQLVLDLRKSKRALLMELRRCAARSNTGCDSDRYAITVELIFPEGRQLSIRTEQLSWTEYAEPENFLIEIRDADASGLTLHAAHQLLMRHVAVLAGQRRAPNQQQEIDRAGAWLLGCCKDNVMYSETLGIQLSHQLGLQFYKNVDRVAVVYLLRPLRVTNNHAARSLRSRRQF